MLRREGEVFRFGTAIGRAFDAGRKKPRRIVGTVAEDGAA
jgi:hypothetical protein